MSAPGGGSANSRGCLFLGGSAPGGGGLLWGGVCPPQKFFNFIFNFF